MTISVNKCLVPVLGVIFFALSTISIAAPNETETRSVEKGLGRVFMSSAQRQSLDRLRHTRPASVVAVTPATDASAAPSSTTTKKPMGVGYIIRSNGVPYQWVEGEFKKTSLEDVAVGSLSADIAIIRHDKPVVNDEQSSAVDKRSETSRKGDFVTTSKSGHDEESQ